MRRFFLYSFLGLAAIFWVGMQQLNAAETCCKCIYYALGDGYDTTDYTCDANISAEACAGKDTWTTSDCELLQQSCNTITECGLPAPQSYGNETDSTTVSDSINKAKPVLNVKLGGYKLEFQTVNCEEGKECVIPWLSQYIDVLYRYGMGIAAFLAVIMVMVGGFLWLMSAGSPDRVSQGKEFITAAISGLVIALFSFTILNFINPNLVNLQPLRILIPKKINVQQVAQEYSSLGCPSDQEKQSGFTSFATGYCQPKRNEYKSDHDFLCAVGLNCSCPSGRNSTKDCASSALTWSSCLPFDANSTPYCNQTAAGGTPQVGQVAADWGCFAKGSQICMNGQTYTVTDKGSAIKGRRFDVWSDTCAGALKVTGNYQVTAGACK